MASVDALAHERWPRWFPRHEFQTTERPVNWPLGLSECSASWIDRSHHLLIVLQVLATAQHGCNSAAPRVRPISGLRLPRRRAQISLCMAPLTPSTSIGCVSCRSQTVEMLHRSHGEALIALRNETQWKLTHGWLVSYRACRGGGRCFCAVSFPRQHHLPRNAGGLVGERHGGQLR
jgi:hypothetical protein